MRRDIERRLEVLEGERREDRTTRILRERDGEVFDGLGRPVAPAVANMPGTLVVTTRVVRAGEVRQ